jgi:hypothetical protein
MDGRSICRIFMMSVKSRDRFSWAEAGMARTTKRESQTRSVGAPPRHRDLCTVHLDEGRDHGGLEGTWPLVGNVATM